MIIDQVPEDSCIEINITSADKKLTLTTVARHPKNKLDEQLVKDFLKKYKFPAGIMADPIEHSGKYVGFHLDEDSETHIAVFSVVEDRPYQWTNVKIITAQFKRKIYHLIMSNQDVSESNRRGSFRQWVGCYGTLKVGLESGSHNVLVKDVSTSGIGLIVDNDPNQPPPVVGDIIHVNFTDTIGRGTPRPKDFDFTLKATVCRTAFEPVKNRTILGCRFAKSDEKIGQYVNMKQTEHKAAQASRK